MGSTTIPLKKDEYKEMINTIRTGYNKRKPNERVAAALTIEANLGLRIGEILKLRFSDIIKDGDRYRLDIVEQKTGKKRTFTVPFVIYQYLENYCLKNKISKDEVIFPISVRQVQYVTKRAAEYLEYKNVSTHSFRKFFADEIYKENNYDIELVQHLLQHSSTAITQRYLKVEKKVDTALANHVCIP